MEKLHHFVMSCLRLCAKSDNNKEIWIHQAFGAVQFYINEHPEEYEEVAAMWNNIKPHFERNIWGINLSL